MFSTERKGCTSWDFNASVVKSVDVDDVICMFGEETCNASGNRLISFLNEVELVICNGRH